MQYPGGNRVLSLLILTSAFLFCAGTLAAEQTIEDENVQSHDSKVEAGTGDALHEVASMDRATECAVTLDFSDQVRGTEPVPMTCTATAYCETGQVSCTGCPADAQDAACPGEEGWVSCSGVKTWCPPCELCDPSCTGRSCSSSSDCHNGGCPDGICRFGTCMCPQ